jgi:two-component system sensor kinase FixL
MGSWDHLRTLELTWSDTARELFGVSDSVQVSYDLFLSLLESDDRKRTEHAIREAVENGRSFDLSYSLRKPSGSIHWVRARGAVAFGAESLCAACDAARH